MRLICLLLLIPSTVVFARPSDFETETKRLRQKYSYLYKDTVKQAEDGALTFDKARLYQREGINALFLKGDRFEMAFQHATLLRDQVRDGAPLQSTKMVRNLIANSFGDREALINTVTNTVDRRITQPILDSVFRDNQPNPYRELQEGVALSEVSGFPVETLIKALFSPETIQVMAGNTLNADGEEVIIMPSPTNCSSFAAYGPYTQNGELIIGRNTDYALNGFFDKYPTVIYFEPNVGQKFMSFVSAGVHTLGLASYNESGIYIAIHTVITENVGTEGIPAILLGGQVVREAKTFDEAVKLFSRRRSNAGWTYLLVSTKEKRMATIELNNKGMGIREATDPHIVQTNHYLTDKMAPSNMFINRSVAEDNDGRRIRIEKLLQDERGMMTPTSAAKILADHFDPIANEVRGLGNTVGVHTTMTSLVLQPEQGKVYVANGMGPVSHNTYVEFPLVGFGRPEDFPKTSYQTIANHQYANENPAQSEALNEFIKAKFRFENFNDTRGAQRYLEKVVQLDSENPAYLFQLGVFYLKNREVSKARATLQKMNHTPYITDQLKYLQRYMLARIHAHNGERAAAIDGLTALLNHSGIDKKMHEAAKEVLRKVRLRGQLAIDPNKLPIMMQQSDLSAYH